MKKLDFKYVNENSYAIIGQKQRNAWKSKKRLRKRAIRHTVQLMTYDV